MDKVQKHNSFNTNTPSSESYKKCLFLLISPHTKYVQVPRTGLEVNLVLSMESFILRIRWN
jgi:hypothetical protein